MYEARYFFLFALKYTDLNLFFIITLKITLKLFFTKYVVIEYIIIIHKHIKQQDGYMLSINLQ